MKSKYSSLSGPLLMSVFPILSFYLTNISELSIRYLRQILPYPISAVLFLFPVLYQITKNKNKSSLILILSLFIFFSYGHVSRYFDDKLFFPLPNNMVLGPDKIFVPVVFLLYFIMLFLIISTRRSLRQITVNISLILFILVCWSTVQIYLLENRKVTSSVSLPAEITAETFSLPGSLPDIYYIIPDGYARQDILSDIYGYDNSAFIAALQKMGFYVAGRSRSNYMHTYLSLPSTLNMIYLDDLPNRYGFSPVNPSAAIDLLFNNSVSKRLGSYGYQTINFESWWSGTGEKYPADVTYRYEINYQIAGVDLPASETDMIFLQTTLLNPLIREIRQDVYRGRILTIFEKLPDIAFLPSPKFVLAHITAPHPPYIFNSDGSLIPGSELENADEGVEKRGKYLNQLVFVSDRILPVLEKIIANSSKPPVIILQSDHGPASIFGKREDWKKNYSQEGINERSGILYAIYIPDRDYKQFYNTITPINTFRIIFNKYFGENWELLPDRTYYTSYEQMYKFVDITVSP